VTFVPLIAPRPSIMRLSILLVALCHLVTSILAASLRINIPPSSLLPNPNTLPASTHATLTSSAIPSPLRAVIRKGNYISFPSSPAPGSYLLNIYTRDYVLAPYRIDIGPDLAIIGAFETYRGTQWSDHGVSLIPGTTQLADTHTVKADALTINAKVLSRKNFYETRQGFSVLSLLKNPMILMGVVALAFTFGMPKLMENMDPEMRAEYEEMQKNSPMGGITKALQGQATGGAGAGADSFDLAGYLAGGGPSQTSGRAGATGDIRERKR
jgi:ER membrane protein complex subunit 7